MGGESILLPPGPLPKCHARGEMSSALLVVGIMEAEAVQPLFAGRSPAGRRIRERLGAADHMQDAIFVDPFLAEQVDERRILDADGSPDEPCVERVGTRYARPCQHAQQRTQSFPIGRVGFPSLKPVVQGWARDAQNPCGLALVE